MISLLLSCSSDKKLKNTDVFDDKLQDLLIDRHIAIVNVDTLKFYLKLAMQDVEITQKGKKSLRVFTTNQKKGIFYRNILGQELEEGSQSILELLRVNNSKYQDKWRSISDDSIYGFESDLFEDDSEYVYIPYEVLIQLNTNRKIK